MAAFETVPWGVTLALAGGDQELVWVNQGFLDLTGYGRHQLLGRNCRLLQGDDRDQAEIATVRDGIVRRRPTQVVLRNYRANGTLFWNELFLVPLEDTTGRVSHFLGFQYDVTAMVNATAALAEERDRWARLAVSDPLTGLPNRAAAEAHLQEWAKGAGTRRMAGTVAMADLDDFKLVNDQYGHDVGDALLTAVAAHLRQAAPFAARWGGDEFLLFWPSLPKSRLGSTMNALFGALSAPISDSLGQTHAIRISLGVSRADRRTAPSSWVRQADQALYMAKSLKGAVSHWVQWEHPPGLAGPFTDHLPSVYGGAAADLLKRVASDLEGAVTAFVTRFYQELVRDARLAEVLGALTAEEFAALQRAQGRHLRRLLDPALTADQHRREAVALGRRHILSGVSGPWLVQSIWLYQELLADALRHAAVSPPALMHLHTIVTQRLAHEMTGQLDGMDQVQRLLADVLGSVAADIVASPDPVRAVDRTLARLLTLDGVVAGSFGRPKPIGGLFEFTSEAGVFRRYRRHWGPGSISLAGTAGSGPVGEAWRTGRIATCRNFFTDPRMLAWREAAERVDIRSSAAIPVPDGQGRLVGVLSLYGRYPNQFEFPWLRQMLETVSQLLGSRWTIPGPISAGPSAGERQMLRASVHEGGLTFWYQPVVDCRSGAWASAEALARLSRPEGGVLSPGRFLPLLGTPEQYEVLLAAVADAKRAWLTTRRRGRRLKVAVNIPPEVLVESGVVDDLLAAWGTHPEGLADLILELVESATVDPALEQARMLQLAQRGVHWALDDLGAGYANLERLTTRPWSFVKVDQGLWGRVAADAWRLLPFLGRTVDMAHGLGFLAVAEGLETDSLVDAARALGFDYAQGYAIAHPMPASDIFTWRPPDTCGQIIGSTALGAYALHWRAVQDVHTDRAACLDAPFFAARPELAEAHASVHQAVAPAPAHRGWERLMRAALAVRASAAGARGEP